MTLSQTAVTDGDMQTLVADSLVWDTHAGIFSSPETELSGIPAWHRHGVDYVSLNIGFDLLDWQTSFRTLAAYRRKLLAMDNVSVIRSVSDIEMARRDGKLAVSFDIEGANALDGDVGLVSAYYDLGVRQLLLAYNRNNLAAGGCHDNDTGLTSFGRAVITEMNRVGMIVDASHVGARTSFEMMECSESPVVFSHSNSRTLCDHQRNISDDQIRACAAQGGVIGINGIGIFLGKNVATDEAFADHACYVADLVGPQHVAIGLDWSPPTKSAPDLVAILRSRPDYWPEGQRYDTVDIKTVSPAQLAGICTILARRGWLLEDIVGFLGGNFQQVAEKVWKN